MINPEAWHWTTLGFLLMALEMLLPGSLLLWFGLSGLVLGFVLSAVDMIFSYQVALFALFALFAYWPIRVFTTAHRSCSELATVAELNQRGYSLIGHRITVTEAVINGFGAARVGDLRWRIACEENLEVGSFVKVIAVIGITLQVHRLSSVIDESFKAR
ncbi:membrane protein implicated in regulation of membrane protease activity [Candidatus Endolissoclinum faulkneri L5]|uniref:Membrane protein implicated in regulation of membrane protease activity n=1 Tax=Candidatus Endolissoclinum faulkneri L5 TaxID=1401328 RepID=V9TQW5_9PROT|nr:NfeD family protein [Candidatus Endolissoclinum faulkneri]AHC73269.1 membrane protein implicated in regulation of membrane protease activity [Candidatus Endolissoclinum faulkneri L5]